MKNIDINKKAKFIGGEFLVHRMVEYGFNATHMWVLKWFEHWSSQGKMKSIRRGGNDFYWISHSKLLSEIPLGSRANASRYMDKLCGLYNREQSNLIPYPMEKYEDQSAAGRRVYYRVVPEGRAYLCGNENERESNPDEEEPNTSPVENIVHTDSAMARKHGTRKSKGTVSDISNRTREIVNTMLGDDSPFSHRVNDPGTPASKTLLKIEEIIKAFHAGIFLDKFPLDQRWARRVDQKVLEDMKGDWNTIIDVLGIAAKKYKQWKTEQPDMKLTKSLAVWLYNPRTQKSLFLSSLSRAHTEREFAGEGHREKIQRIERQSAEACDEIIVQRSAWNKYVYWKAMYSIVRHLKRNWQVLKEINGKDFHYHRVSEMIENYGTFLLRKTAADPNYMAYGQFHWEEFVDDFWDSKQIDLDPEECKKAKKSA